MTNVIINKKDENEELRKEQLKDLLNMIKKMPVKKL
jgi:hypothetical protein